MSVRRDDDQIDVFFPGVLIDFIICLSCPDHSPRRHLPPDNVFDQSIEFLTPTRPELLLYVWETNLTETKISRVDRRLDDINEIDRRVELTSERNGVLQGFLRAIGKIDGD